MGGLSVVREVRKILPHHDLCYLADTAYCPYGNRPVEEIRQRARACSRWLIEQGAHIIVVACNTATSAAMELLRAEFPIPFVGMEPGVKPAITATRTHKVGVLATSGTLSGERFASLVRRFAEHMRVEVEKVPCPDLVYQVESGDMDGPRTQELLQGCISSLLANDVDTIVLGCSHFHFVAPLLSRMTGPDVTIIDTAPAVAQQVARVAIARNIPTGHGLFRCATTGQPGHIAPIIARLCDMPLTLEHAHV
jgi:glutamate racemase